jgi:hypothetical protein
LLLVQSASVEHGGTQAPRWQMGALEGQSVDTLQDPQE